MKSTSKHKLFQKTLLAAASTLMVFASEAKAYDQTGWHTQDVSRGYQYSYGPYNTGGGAWIDGVTYSAEASFSGVGGYDVHRSRAGLYNVSTTTTWSNNNFGGGEGQPAMRYDAAYTNFLIDGVQQNSISFPVDNINGDHYTWNSSPYFLPIDDASLRSTWNLAGDNGTYLSAGAYALTERVFQVARTGSGINGQYATAAFELDNQSYGSNYSVYSDRNVLRLTSFYGTAANEGSVVRNGDIRLGNLGVQDGLYAKDAGWLDIRGGLTISNSYGQLYIRDAEITSSVFTDNNTYGNDIARTNQNFFFESGILSVRDHFAQDMYVYNQQTVAFRDGAVNNTDINIDGEGYNHSGLGSTGGLRSITGNNIQNGNVGIGWLNGWGIIAADTGSTLTINGSVNGINGAQSGGGANLYYNVGGTLVQNGNVSAGIGSIHKDGSGLVTLNANNTFAGYTYINDGTLAIGTTGTLVSDAYVYSGGTLSVNGRLKATGGFSGSVDVYSGGTLKGTGRIDGSVFSYGTVAPGNSPGTLSIYGNYNSSQGSLDLELANHAGVAGTSYDQLRVDGGIYVSNALAGNYSTIKFVDVGDFAAVRGDVFQVIADLNGHARNTYDKFDLAQYVTGSGDRVIFDHSTGKAYGTGLTLGTGTFRDYGVSANQKEIGRALWMESISYDKHSGFQDENFASTANNTVAAAAQRGYKAYILTNHSNVYGELPTDLGLAAVSVLAAPSAGAALDALSPEPYAGIADQGMKVSRSFVRQLYDVRHRDGASDDWDFQLGYANDQLTSKGTSSYNSYATKSNQVSLSASRTFGKDLSVTVAVGSDDGKVTAANFDTKVKTGTVGLDIAYTPDATVGRFDLAASLSTADWDSNRGGALASEKGQHSLSVGGRFTLAPIATNGVTLSPYIGVAYARSRVEGFTETDVAGSVQLQVNGFREQSLQSELGLNLSYQYDPQTVITGLASWEHEFHSAAQANLNSEFVDAGVTDTRFTVKSNGFGTNLFRLGLAVRYDITALSSASLGYNVILGQGVSAGSELRANYSVRF